MSLLIMKLLLPDVLKMPDLKSVVNSFDLTATGVIIWTRYSAGTNAEITWEISK